MTDRPNPYESPVATSRLKPEDRIWQDGSESYLVSKGLLQRKVQIVRPVQVTIEYFARGLRDRILVDDRVVLAKLPIFWLNNRFQFQIPFRDGTLPARIELKTRVPSLQLKYFTITIDHVRAYHEEDQVPQ